MCGRVQLTHSADEIAEFFDLDPSQLEPGARRDLSTPRFNVAPGARLPVLRFEPDAASLQLGTLRWGLVPAWAKDEKIGYRLINARSETAAEKPSFRSAWKRRRCVVVASGFYEWWRRKPKARPERAYHFYPVDEPMFAFAGLWERWDREDGAPLETCTILTRDATKGLRAIHDRQPVILSKPQVDRWLAPGDPPPLCEISAPDAGGVRVAVDEVSTLVNDARNEDAACIEASPPLGVSERLMKRRGWLAGFEATAFGPQARWRDPDSGATGQLDPSDPGLAKALLAEMDAASVDVTRISQLAPAEVAEAWLAWRS